MRGHPPQLDGLAAKTKSPQFSSGFILAHQLREIGHPANSDSNAPGVRLEQQTEEAGARLHSSHHRYFRRVTEKSLPAPSIVAFAGYHPQSKLPALVNY